MVPRNTQSVSLVITLSPHSEHLRGPWPSYVRAYKPEVLAENLRGPTGGRVLYQILEMRKITSFFMVNLRFEVTLADPPFPAVDAVC